MKKFALAILAAALLIIAQQPASGQARLHILRLVNYPQSPADTALIGQVYGNIHIHVKNTGNSAFFGDIHTYLYSQALGSSYFDTLRDDPFHSNIFIGAGDSVSITANPNYQFRQIHYAAGDNIVVVWPFSGGTLFDTYTTQVFFNAPVGIAEQEETVADIHPNPVSNILRIDYGIKNAVKRVRIYDLFGRELFSANQAIPSIDLSGFTQGIYFLEILDDSDRRSIIKIMVNNN